MVTVEVEVVTPTVAVDVTVGVAMLRHLHADVMTGATV